MAQFITPIVEKVNNKSLVWAEPKINEAILTAKKLLGSELDRLEYLAQVNPNMNTEEIEHFKEKISQVSKYLETVKPRIDGIRVIFTEPRSF